MNKKAATKPPKKLVAAPEKKPAPQKAGPHGDAPEKTGAGKGRLNAQSPFPVKPLYRFSDRVLTITLPTAFLLAILVATNELDPGTAIISFGTVVMLTIVLMVPFMIKLQNLAEYTRNLSVEGASDLEKHDFSGSDDETAQIVRAINDMRNIWSSRAEALEVQTLSDAAVLDSLPDPLIMLGEDGTINGANLAARDLFGHNIREKHIRRVISDEKVIEAIIEVMDKKAERKDVLFTLPSPWKKTLRAAINALPWESRGGAVAVVALNDITALKKVENMQADFVANASHELRTPLSVLSGFIETLQGPAKDDPEARDKFLAIMHEQATRMTQLVEDLLTLSRIEMNESGPRKPVDIPAVLKTVKRGLEAKASSRSMDIVLDLPENLPEVMGNHNELSQVFQNIVDNAIKYGGNDSKIDVTACAIEQMPQSPHHRTAPGAGLQISVTNYGDVIPPEILPRLTERFYRMDTERGREVGGTGLGLAIVSQAIRRHKGMLEITSGEEHGTCFTVSLPLGVRAEDTENPPTEAGA